MMDWSGNESDREKSIRLVVSRFVPNIRKYSRHFLVLVSARHQHQSNQELLIRGSIDADRHRTRANNSTVRDGAAIRERDSCSRAVHKIAASSALNSLQHVDVASPFFRAREKDLADPVDSVVLGQILVLEIVTVEQRSVLVTFARLEKTKLVHFVF